MTVVGLSCLAWGCGTGDGGGPGREPDAGPPDGGGGTPACPVAPRIPDWVGDEEPPVVLPAPPAILPCPDGWRERATAAGTAYCDPFRSDELPTCEDLERPVPGRGCVPPPVACPDARWPTELPDDGVVYVDADAAPGGNGSEESPYDTLPAALGGASEGDTIALAAGRYLSGGFLRDGQTLRGVCADRVAVSVEDALVERGAINVVGGEGIVIRDVRFEDVPGPAILVIGASEVLVDGVVVDGFRGTGIGAGMGARLEVRDTLIRNAGEIWTTTSQLYQSGWGLGAFSGAEATVQGSALVDVRGSGVRAEDARVVLEDSTIARVRLPTPSAPKGIIAGTNGRGVDVDEGGAVTLRRAALRDSRLGVACRRNGELTVDRSYLAGFAPDDDGPRAGSGAWLVCARSSITRSTIRDAEVYGIQVFGAAGPVVLTDVLLLSNGFDPEGVPQGGLGIAAPNVAIGFTAIEDTGFAGILTVPGGGATLSDVRVTGTRPRQTGGGGRGLQLQSGPVTGQRVLVDGAVRDGVRITEGVGFETAFADLTVTDVEAFPETPTLDAEPGVGVRVTGDRLEVDGLRVTAVADRAIQVEGTGSALEVTDLDVSVADLASGAGVLDGGILVLEGARIVTESGSPIVARMPNSRLLVQSAQLTGGGTDPLGGPPGIEVAAGATAGAEDVEVTRWTGAAVRVVDGNATLTRARLIAAARSVGEDDGVGVLALGDADVVGVTVAIEGARHHGVLAAGEARVALEGSCIADVAPFVCASPECDGEPTGVGVGVYGGAARLELAGLTLLGALSCGLVVDRSPTSGVDTVESGRATPPFAPVCVSPGTAANADYPDAMVIEGYAPPRLALE